MRNFCLKLLKSFGDGGLSKEFLQEGMWFEDAMFKIKGGGLGFANSL